MRPRANCWRARARRWTRWAGWTATASNCCFHRGQEEAQIEPDQIDVCDGEHHLALENYPFVEDVTEQIGKLESLITENVARAHSFLWPTKW